MKEELITKEASMLVPFLVGGVVGAGVALLLAPKSGKELRDDIKDLASKTRDKVTATIEEGKNLYDGGRVAIEAAKQTFREERDRRIKAA